MENVKKTNQETNSGENSNSISENVGIEDNSQTEDGNDENINSDSTNIENNDELNQEKLIKSDNQ